MNRVNDYLARQIWAKISTELDHQMMQAGKLNDEHERFPWMLKRAEELLEEYIVEKKPEKPGKKVPVEKVPAVKEKHEEKAED